MQKASIVSELIQENTRVGSLLQRISETTLNSYSKELVNFHSIVGTDIQRDREIVLTTLRDMLSCRAFKESIDGILDQFASYPVLQTADHCQLFYDPETFINNLIYQLGMRQLGLKYMITLQCSTVRMLMYKNPFIGPAFIDIGNVKYKVFDKSNRKLSNSHVATLKNVKFIFTPQNLGRSFNQELAIPQILEAFKGTSYENAAEAFLDANARIWNQIYMSDKLELVLLDEAFAAAVVARMISVPDHPLRLLLFDRTARRIFTEEIRRYINSPESLILRDSTDFFYGSNGDELITLRLDEAEASLIPDKSSKLFKVAFNPEAVIDALKQRKLYPNLIIAFLGFSIFPMITAIGGSSQYEYLPSIQLILNRTLLRIDLLEERAIDHLTNSVLTTMVGGLIERNEDLVRIIQTMDIGTNMTPLEQRLKKLLIGELIGTGSNFEYFRGLFQRRNEKSDLHP